jgi:hypothetical protein
MLSKRNSTLSMAVSKANSATTVMSVEYLAVSFYSR